MRVFSSVMPPPKLSSKILLPENTVGKRKAVMALVSLARSNEVLLVNVLQHKICGQHRHIITYIHNQQEEASIAPFPPTFFLTSSME